MKRLVVEWSGPAIKGRAVNVLHFMDDTVDPAQDAFNAYTIAAGLLPNTTTITIPGGGDLLENSTGELIDVWSAPGGSHTVSSTGGGSAAGGVGACATWLTSGIERGHRVRGRTFFVPLIADSFDGDGTLTPTAMNLLNNWAASLAGSSLAVWHRPTAKGAADGNLYPVGGYRVRDKVAFLSSRRD